MTSKLQVTIPKSLAQQSGIRPGDEIEWAPAADGIRITPLRSRVTAVPVEVRVDLFDAATKRQMRRQRGRLEQGTSDRGWKRSDLYSHGRSR